jgi:hypothetical protein
VNSPDDLTRRRHRSGSSGRLGPAIGLIGTSDLDDFGDQVLSQVTQRELSARIPDADIRLLAPLGWNRSTPMSGGTVSEPLGPHTEARQQELADTLDAVVITGPDVAQPDDVIAQWYAPQDGSPPTGASAWFVDALGLDREATVATAWNAVGVPHELSPDLGSRVRRALERRAYVSVRDEISCRHLEATGLQREVSVVPDPGFLIPRLMDASVGPRRLAFHRLMGWIPPRPYLLLQASQALSGDAEALLRAMRQLADGEPELAVVVVDSGSDRGGTGFADTIGAAYPNDVFRVPPPLVVQDLAALVQSAELVVASSFHFAVSAASFGRPAALLDVGESPESATGRLPASVARVRDVAQLPVAAAAARRAPLDDADIRALQADVDRHFDALAEVISVAAERRDPARHAARVELALRRSGAMRLAHEARSVQVGRERAAFAQRLEAETARHEQVAGQLAQEQARRLAAEQALDIAEERASDADKRAHDLQLEVDALHSTRLFRWTRWLRRAYSWWRAR